MYVINIYTKILKVHFLHVLYQFTYRLTSFYKYWLERFCYFSVVNDASIGVDMVPDPLRWCHVSEKLSYRGNCPFETGNFPEKARYIR